MINFGWMVKRSLATHLVVAILALLVLAQPLLAEDKHADTVSTVSEVEDEEGLTGDQHKTKNEEKEPGKYITLPGTGMKVFVPETGGLMEPEEVFSVQSRKSDLSKDDPKAILDNLKQDNQDRKEEIKELQKLVEIQKETIRSLEERLEAKQQELEMMSIHDDNSKACESKANELDKKLEQIEREKGELATKMAEYQSELTARKNQKKDSKEFNDDLYQVWRETLIVDEDEVLDILRDNGILEQSENKGRDPDGNKNWTYIGETWNDISWGKGKVTWSDGYSYDGEWREDMQWGLGTSKWADGATFTGHFRQDLRWGYGEFRGANGYKYSGEYERGKAHGRGKMEAADGATYEGEWENGVCSGAGKMHFANGRIYEGEWVDNQPEGIGKMWFPSGDYYEGSWKQGQCWGEGMVKFANGQRYIGEWKENKFWGAGKFEWPDGQSYEGSWKEDKYDGKGKLTLSDGTVKEGTWSQGKFVN